MRGMPFCSDMRRRSEFTNNVTRRYVVQSGKRARTSVTRFWWRRQRCTGKEKSVSQIHPRALDRAEWEKQGRHTRAQLQCHLAYRSPSWERNHTGWRRRKRGTASCLYNWMSSTRCRRRTTRWNGQRQHKLGQKEGGREGERTDGIPQVTHPPTLVVHVLRRVEFRLVVYAYEAEGGHAHLWGGDTTLRHGETTRDLDGKAFSASGPTVCMTRFDHEGRHHTHGSGDVV